MKKFFTILSLLLAVAMLGSAGSVRATEPALHYDVLSEGILTAY